MLVHSYFTALYHGYFPGIKERNWSRLDGVHKCTYSTWHSLISVPAIRSPKWTANEGPIYGPTIIMAGLFLDLGRLQKGFLTAGLDVLCAMGGVHAYVYAHTYTYFCMWVRRPHYMLSLGITREVYVMMLCTGRNNLPLVCFQKKIINFPNSTGSLTFG